MTAIIDTLSTEEQKKIDPQLFTCCPHCNRDFKIPDVKSITRGDWMLMKDASFYKGERLRISPSKSHLLYELAKSPYPVLRETLAYRICTDKAADSLNVISVHICRLRSFLQSINIPFPIKVMRPGKVMWVRT